MSAPPCDYRGSVAQVLERYQKNLERQAARHPFRPPIVYFDTPIHGGDCTITR